MRSWKKVVGVFLFNLVVVWAVMEVVLRTAKFDYLKTYSEKVNNKYYSSFPSGTHTTYGTNLADSIKWLPTPEFNYLYKYNSNGLRDVDHTIQKPIKVKRYLAFGDSFTEGVGAPVDSTWWKLLENKLNNAIPDSAVHEVMGAGNMGSDIAYCFHLLQDKLVKYEPDVVFYCLNSTDITDLAIRGGMERFTPDGKIQYRVQAPWWEPIYQYSFVLRAWVHQVLKYDFFFTTQQQQQENNKYGINQICQIASDMNQYCATRKIRFVLIIQPLAYQVKSHSTILDTVDRYCQKSAITTINLFNAYNTYPADSLPVIINKYYWPVDGHCKPAGYDFMAAEIFKHAGEW